jgi:hypothetical protein|nr:MAG TPA: CHAP domain protein [Caudoviricetes sp.]
MTNAYQVAQRVVGQSIDVDGGPPPPYSPYQCVDLVNWVAQQFGGSLWGNGNQIGIGNDVSSFADVIPYTNESQLQVGDIISTNETTTPYGHTLVYGGGGVDNARVIEQNFNNITHVIEHTRSITGYGATILRIVRIRGQDNYTPDGSSGTSADAGKPNKSGGVQRTFYEIVVDKVEGIKGNGDNTVLDTFYKCNKVTGKINGEWLIYDKYNGMVGYLPKSAVKEKTEYSKQDKESGKKEVEKANGYDKFSDKTSDGLDQSGTQQIYTLAQFISLGRVEYSGYEWTYSSGNNFPTSVNVNKSYNAYGFLSDQDGHIILSVPSSWGDVKGRLYDTPFGFKGKAYLTNEKTSIDVYVR